MAETVRNDELLELVKAMREAYRADRENSTDETKAAISDANNKVINQTLRCTFLVPAIIDKNTKLVQDKDNHLRFQENPQAKFMLIKHKENGTFFPVFTDIDEFKRLETKEDFKAVNMKFADIATLTEQTPTVNGFVINPVTTNLAYTKEMLLSIKQTLIKARQQKEAAEAAANAGSDSAEGIQVSEGGKQ